MMFLRSVFISVFVLSFLPAKAAPAGLSTCVDLLRSVAGKAKRTYMELATKDLSHTDLEVFEATTGVSRILHLGEQVGIGCRGAVYRIDSAIDGTPRVAKIEKSFRLPTLSRHKAIIPESTDREENVTQLLLDSVAEIEKSKFFPKDPAWEKGSFPVVPIIEAYSSPAGVVLVKPEVVNPKKVRALKLDSKGRLAPDVEQALHDIYDLHLAVNDRVAAVGLDIKEGMHLDIGTNNLFWVESAKDLVRFKMKRPGFCMFEVDQGAAFEEKGGQKVLNPNFRFYPTWESFKTAAIKDIRAL